MIDPFLSLDNATGMKPGLQVGTVGELAWVVDPSMTISLGGLPSATVFSTPNMIMLMERAAREAIRPYLEEGEESVGVDVNVEHIGAAVLGARVRAEAKVSGIEGRRLDFDVRALVGDREIGRGRHRRALIQLERLVANISQQHPAKDQVAPLTPPRGELGPLSTLKVEVSDQVAFVTFNRPAAAHAVNVAMTNELERLVAWLAVHPQEVRVVILTGGDRTFCAGDDVKEVATLSLDAAHALSLRQANVYLAFERLPQPIVAAVGGPAFGAGCVAAYSCDWRIASHAARFAMPEIKLGWPPGYGVAQLTALVGKARALQLCLTGDPISAAQALEWGLVNEVVPGGHLHARAREIAARLKQLPAEALRETKRLIHADEGALPQLTHRADTAAYIRCLALPDAQEGIAAFVEKRPPRFTGH